MIREIVYTALAGAELLNALEWYSQEEIGMGELFLAEVERVEGVIKLNPTLYRPVRKDARRANLDRFPYAIIYVVDDDIVTVLAFFHQHASPDKMRI